MELRGTHSALIERESRGFVFVWNGPPPFLPPITAPPKNFIFTRMEEPPHVRWYSPQQRVIQAAAVSFPPEGRSVITSQEAPYHPSVVAAPFYFQSIAVSIPPRGSVFVRQEPIHQPPPFLSNSVFSLQFSLVGRIVLSDIEEPGNDLPPRLWPGAPPVAASIAFNVSGRSLITAQEQPFHPLPWLRSSYTTGFTFTAAGRSWITRQEEPYHPGPWLRTHAISTFFQPTGRSILITQQEPYHPAGILRSHFVPPLVFQPSGRSWIGRQEEPYHPAPVALAQFIPPIRFNATGRSAFNVEPMDPYFYHAAMAFPGIPPVTPVSPSTTHWEPTPGDDPTFSIQGRLSPVQWPFGGLNIKTKLGSG